MDLQISNKKAIVFGSSAGIGKAIAESLLNENAQVIINSRNEDKLKSVSQQIKATGFITADLSQPGEAQKAIQNAISKMGGLDFLIMNTGGPQKGNFMDISQEQWLFDYQNLWLSFVEAVKTVLPIMKEQNFGRILLVTSLAAKEPLPGLTTSNGLRAGLSGLCKSLANEVASYGITVNVLLPGYTNTDRLKELKLSEEKVKQLVPAGRLGDPKELADLACYLCSPLAGYITGQSIAIDGGALKH